MEPLSVPEIAIARYAAPGVTLTPVTEVISSDPIAGRRSPGHYQHVLLNTGTGELSFHESTEHLEVWNPDWKAINDVPRETWERWHPGRPFEISGPHAWFNPVPELVCWTIDSGVPERPYLDVATANALLEEVEPYAKTLLDNLFDAGGDLDWSAESARAGRNILRLCLRYHQVGAADVDADLVEFAAIVQRFPNVYRPELLRLSLDKLAEECEYITRFLGSNERWHSEIKKVFGRPYREGGGIELNVLGVRAWYRTALLKGDPRPARDFADWDAEHHCLTDSGITSTASDAQLEDWAERQEVRAARVGLRLLGALEAAHAHREHLRAQEWDRLAVVGADIEQLERQLKEKRAARLALVTNAITWGRSDIGIAERGRMTRQAVYKIRKPDGGDSEA